MITVKQLKAQLADLPDDMPIILQTDDEGNGYRYIRGIDGDDSFFDSEEGECLTLEDVIFEEKQTTDYTKVAVIY